MQNNKRLFFVTNTKMSKGIKESIQYFEELNQKVADLGGMQVEIAVMLPYAALYAVKSSEKRRGILLGAQNVCGGREIGYTGEISIEMLKELEVDCVMAGHSDRRCKMNESNEEIRKKVLLATEQDICVYLCIGETEQQKQQGITEEVLKIQLKKCLQGVSTEKLHLLRILYEPVWAIGVSGAVVSPQYAEKSHEIIRNCLAELYGQDRADSIPIIYGGSVDKENALPLIEQQQIDGLGIGRNAWDAEGFNRIIRKVIFEQKRGKSDAENIE
ncbi:Bifunctional PGK/TIM [uncultured Clostridium sp.]|uniref:Triosephosphate isomerase n=1 Tax=Muricoprocola aceti TaxID=2981772 RepID=A0ABT2SQD8_9FIRM|nr:triose-phosphate isomerase family protein [Muricoprocola aceti]MCU6726700.1 triose-phosphate isomerase [Muricoprocola aceti]SCI00106.1 Bifunctional PGK/TIM [uncultured Clostridium sp.]